MPLLGNGYTRLSLTNASGSPHGRAKGRVKVANLAVVIINEKGLVPNHGTSPFCCRCGTSHCVLILGATNRVFVPLCYLGGEFLSSAFEI